MILPVAQPATRPTMIHQSIAIACLLQRREFCALKCGHVKSSAESRGRSENHCPCGLVRAASRNGGASRDRTDDLIVANDALSQLSYSPTVASGLQGETQINLSRLPPGHHTVSPGGRGWAR